MDQDLLIIQSVRDQIRASRTALAALSHYSQEEINALVKKVMEACSAKAEYLAKLAVEETGFGNWPDKVLKNTLAGPIVYESIKDLKTVGIVNEQTDKHFYEVAQPVGVIAALVPSTNPTSTVIYKTLISLKSANTIIFAPHPSALRCIQETVDIIRAALQTANAPVDIVQCLQPPLTMAATTELMQHKEVGLILATGGPGMVKAAYSSGNPAIGVGAGNGPAFIEKSADLPTAVRHIIESKTFDNGVICASEQSIVTEVCMEQAVLRELEAQGAYILNAAESEALGKVILRSNGSMNPAIVGKTAPFIAAMAGLAVPESTKVLVSKQTEVSHSNGYAREKLCPILAFYVEANWENACQRCIQLLENEGQGHTMTIHSKDEKIIREFALKKPVSRLLVNTPAALGGVGATTCIAPAFTLGCGAVGKSSTSDNITPLNLINLRRVAYGVKELADLRGSNAVTPARAEHGVAVPKNPQKQPELTQSDLEQIVQTVITRLQTK